MAHQRRVLLVALAVVAVTSLGCSSAPPPASTTAITMRDVAFSPTAVSVPAGKTARLTFSNSASQVHDFTVERMTVGTVRMQGGMTQDHNMVQMSTAPAMHIAVAGGKSATLDFQPATPGDYEFYCSVPGHREAGMRGTLHVE